jgi:hypothetical protein
MAAIVSLRRAGKTGKNKARQAARNFVHKMLDDEHLYGFGSRQI